MINCFARLVRVVGMPVASVDLHQTSRSSLAPSQANQRDHRGVGVLCRAVEPSVERPRQRLTTACTRRRLLNTLGIAPKLRQSRFN